MLVPSQSTETSRGMFETISLNERKVELPADRMSMLHLYHETGLEKETIAVSLVPSELGEKYAGETVCPVMSEESGACALRREPYNRRNMKIRQTILKS